MYLIDTNIFLEGLLDQEKADSVRSFFSTVDLGQMAITDLALHSIGIILFRFGKYEIFNSFLNDLIIDGIEVITLNADDLLELEGAIQNFNLDFDDAYQYLVAEKSHLVIISFDTDFDNTELGRKEPSEILWGLSEK